MGGDQYSLLSWLCEFRIFEDFRVYGCVAALKKYLASVGTAGLVLVLGSKNQGFLEERNWVDMALFMPPGTIAETDAEKADLDAINAIKESAAIEFKVSASSLISCLKKILFCTSS